jgi:CRISPR-associated endonuclease Csn1
MRLIRGDFVRLNHDGEIKTLRLCKMSGDGVMAFAATIEANVDARTRTKEISYIFKTAGSMQKSEARRITISPIGELNDPGFKA